MKKFLLSVAVFTLVTLSANAESWSFTGANSGSLGTYTGDAVYVENTSLSATVDVLAGTFSGYPGLSIGAKHSSGTSKISWKFGADYFQADAGDAYLVVNSVTAGSTVTIQFSAKGGTAVTPQELIVGKGSASIDAVYPNNLTYVSGETAPAIVSGESAVIKTAVYTANTNGTVAFKSNTGYRIYSIVVDSGTGATNIISSDLLNKVGNELINPTNLEITIISVGGSAVLKSSEASINLSSLPTGQYIAVTAQGNLKFIK